MVVQEGLEVTETLLQPQTQPQTVFDLLENHRTRRRITGPLNRTDCYSDMMDFTVQEETSVMV